MKTKEFLKKYEACCDGARWALSIGKEMVDVWDAMITEGKHAWLIWTATRPDVFPSSTLRKLACRFVRETPLLDDRKVWDLLTDERSRKAVEVAELYADGKATNEELKAASDAAFAAAYDSVFAAAYDSVYVAARTAAYAAAYAAAHAARAADAAYTAANAAYTAACTAANAAYTAACTADAHAKAAQIKMIAEIGNPFRKGRTNA